MPEADPEGGPGGEAVTTPGGVANLPPGALVPDTMESQLQDTSEPAMRTRAAQRFPSTFNSSTGGNPAVDLSPFGILARLFAGFNSTVAEADPADITGPEDLPGLLWDFIASLPVIGQFVDLLDAIAGHYEGEDQVLLTVQAIFAPIRALVDLVANFFGDIGEGIPTVEEVTAGWNGLVGFVNGLGQAIVDAFNGDWSGAAGLLGQVGDAIAGLLGIGLGAQATADAGWNQITAINAILAGLTGSGVHGSDEFDGASTPDLSAKYVQATFVGGGPGKYRLNGAGRAIYAPSGFIATGTINMLIDEVFAEKYQTTAFYLPNRIGNGTAMYLFNRLKIDDDGLQGTMVDIGPNNIRAAYILNSVINYIGPTQSYAGLTGEYWDFTLGDPADGSPDKDYKYVVKRNGVSLFTYYDTDHHVDADDPAANRIAWGAYSGANFPTQLSPVDVETFGWFDKAPLEETP